MKDKQVSPQPFIMSLQAGSPPGGKVGFQELDTGCTEAFLDRNSQ